MQKAKSEISRKQYAEGLKLEAEGNRQKAESRRLKEESTKRKVNSAAILKPALAFCFMLSALGLLQ